MKKISLSLKALKITCSILCGSALLHSVAAAKGWRHEQQKPMIWKIDDEALSSSPVSAESAKIRENVKNKGYLFPISDDEEIALDAPAAPLLLPPQGGVEAEASLPQQTGVVRRVLTVPQDSQLGPNAATSSTAAAAAPRPATGAQAQNTVFVRLTDVAAAEFVRMVSRITNKNFIFDEVDLDFNVTVISEEPTTSENLMTMLLQELRIHGLYLIEQGNNFIIHRNAKVNSISRVVDDTEQGGDPLPKGVEIITQIFRLNTLNLQHAIAVLTPLTSSSALIEPLADGNQLVITDLASNIAQIKKLLRTIDAPKGGLVVGQYMAKNTALETLVALAEKILLPMSREQPLVFVPHAAAGSIFVVASPFFVERSLAILDHIDQTQGQTGIYDERARAVKAPEIRPSEERAAPNAQDLQQVEPGEWSEVKERKVFKPKLAPTEGTGEKPPTGEWKHDSEGKWNFEAKPSGTVGGAKGARATGGQWSAGPGGEWQYEGGARPQLPEGGLPPMGSWYRDQQGNLRFEKASNYEPPEGGTPPVGQWIQDELGGWFFEQAGSYAMPKGGMPPRGKWFRDEAGNWQFQRIEEGTPGGFPEQAVWVREAEGNWGAVPSSLPAAAKGTYPEGIWHYNDEDGSWQFLEGRKFEVPAGAPPEGYWTKSSEGRWQFRTGSQGAPGGGVTGIPGSAPDMPGGAAESAPGGAVPAAAPGGVPKEGFWTVDDKGLWRYVVKEKALQSTYPMGFWSRDKANKWKFQEVKPADLTEGGLPVMGSWVQDAQGNWSAMPGSIPEGSMPKGTWQRSTEGKWAFVQGKTPAYVEPPKGTWELVQGKWQFLPGVGTTGGMSGGVWSVDDFGRWRLLKQPGQETKGPQGFWARTARGDWIFQEFKSSDFSAGGAGEAANWVLDQQGNWSLMPGSLPAGSDGQNGMPEGVWRNGEFIEGQKPVFTKNPPPVGSWQKKEGGECEFVPGKAGAAFPGSGTWTQDNAGGWRFIPTGKVKECKTVFSGVWMPKESGWGFVRDEEKWVTPEGTVEAPRGYWTRDSQGKWVFILAQGEAVQSRRLLRPEPPTVELPLGHIERTQFFIYKMQFRNGEQVQESLRRIAESLFTSTTTNEDLISAINSTQWLASSNSLIFTGTTDALRKVRELVEEIDRPLRQIFLDMLIMQVGVDDSLEYGVTWASAFGGPDVSGAQVFNAGATPVQNLINSAGIVNGVPSVPNGGAAIGNPPLSDYTMGIVGRKITHCGTEFGSISAIVRAQHDRSNADVLMNPKILTEDNATAEIFVGITQPFKTQSIANDQGNTITSSFDFRDVGTRLNITPIIGDNDIITLEIKTEISQTEPTPGASGNVNNDPPPTISKITTTTRVHVPNNYFLVMSGMIQDTLSRTRNQVPCLGGIPIIGALFSRKITTDSKRNLMIFVNPRIIDTDADVQSITKHEQDVFRIKNKLKGSWRFEVDEALDLMNISEIDQISFRDKLADPVCKSEIRPEVDEYEDACIPCGEAGSSHWRDNRRLYH